MPLPKTGKRTEAQRRARNKYEKGRFTILGAKVTIEMADQVKRACAAAGTTPNAIIISCLRDFLEQHPAPEIEPEAAPVEPEEE